MTHWTDQLFKEQSDLFVEALERREESTPGEVADLLELLAERHDLSPARTLDVACGIGRHVLALAPEVSHAEGLDYNEEYVDRARERAREQGLSDATRFRHADMRNLDEFEGSYDLVTSFWNSIGYYDRDTDREVLAAARDRLADGGALVVEMGNKAHHLREFDGSVARETDDYLLVDRAEYEPETGRIHTTVDRFRVTDEGYEHVATTEFRPRIYAPVELKELCLDAGFESVSLYGGFDGAELAIDSQRVVAVAE